MRFKWGTTVVPVDQHAINSTDASNGDRLASTILTPSGEILVIAATIMGTCDAKVWYIKATLAEAIAILSSLTFA